MENIQSFIEQEMNWVLKIPTSVSTYNWPREMEPEQRTDKWNSCPYKTEYEVWDYWSCWNLHVRGPEIRELSRKGAPEIYIGVLLNLWLSTCACIWSNSEKQEQQLRQEWKLSVSTREYIVLGDSSLLQQPEKSQFSRRITPALA